MAGPAPAENRRRTNTPARGEWVDLPPIVKPILPKLPEMEDGEWSSQTRATWEMWRNDPATSQYTPAEISYALDAIRLYEVMTPSSANEVRLRMDGLGLTPKGKRDLRYRVAQTEEEGDETHTRRRRSRTRDSERRNLLRAV